MSISVQKVLGEARLLVDRLKEFDNNTSNLMTNAQRLNDSVELMKEYHEEMTELSSTSYQKPRSSIILTIQRESKQLKKLEKENHELKCALEDHHFALELIMSKYRQQINKLIEIREEERKSLAAIGNNSSDILAHQTNKIYEMVAVMNRAIEIDENKIKEENCLIAQLREENKGLRELLKIATDAGSIPTKIL